MADLKAAQPCSSKLLSPVLTADKASLAISEKEGPINNICIHTAFMWSFAGDKVNLARCKNIIKKQVGFCRFQRRRDSGNWKGRFLPDNNFACFNKAFCISAQRFYEEQCSILFGLSVILT